MKKILLMAGVATALFAANANAFDYSQYVSAKLTYAFASHDYKWKSYPDGAVGANGFNDKVFGGNVAYGLRTGPFRTELELNLKDDAEKMFHGKSGGLKLIMKNKFALLNTYYDINTGTKFTPYVGLGVGVAKLKAKEINQENSKYITGKKDATNFAWQIGAGVNYALTDNWSVDLGYRYLDEGHVKYEDAQGYNKFEAKSHEILLGARYTF